VTFLRLGSDLPLGREITLIRATNSLTRANGQFVTFQIVCLVFALSHGLWLRIRLFFFDTFRESNLQKVVSAGSRDSRYKSSIHDFLINNDLQIDGSEWGLWFDVLNLYGGFGVTNTVTKALVGLRIQTKYELLFSPFWAPLQGSQQSQRRASWVNKLMKQ